MVVIEPPVITKFAPTPDAPLLYATVPPESVAIFAVVATLQLS